MRKPKLNPRQQGGYKRCKCGEYFYYQPSQASKKYCSRKCFFKHQPRLPLYRFVCKECTQEFFRDHPRKLDCCSRACSINYRRAKFAARMADRKCNFCQKQLNRTQERFCSRQCITDFFRSCSTALVTCICPCGKKYYAYRSRLKDGRDSRCSPDCAKKFRRKGVFKHCGYCGVDFYVLPADDKRGQNKYCSHECAAKAKQRWKTFLCRFCGKKFKRRGPHKFMYCSKNCMNDDVSSQRKVGKRKNPRLIYSPELLRFMGQSNSTTCSFPGCFDPCGQIRNPWNACPLHGQKIQRALHEANKRRLRILSQHGLAPV